MRGLGKILLFIFWLFNFILMKFLFIFLLLRYNWLFSLFDFILRLFWLEDIVVVCCLFLELIEVFLFDIFSLKEINESLFTELFVLEFLFFFNFIMYFFDEFFIPVWLRPKSTIWIPFIVPEINDVLFIFSIFLFLFIYFKLILFLILNEIL